MKIKLSARMQTIADMVIPGEPVADIGTDHGYIPAYLLSENICSKVILTDVNEGPISRAKENLESFGLYDQDLRVGNGLEVIDNGEVSTAIIAGMGGELIEEILWKDKQKSLSINRIIVQPRTYCDELRLSLQIEGFEIDDYRLVKEKERICEVIAVSYTGNCIKDDPVISNYFLDHKDPLLQEFIDYKIKTRQVIIDNLQNAKQSFASQIDKLTKEIEYLKSL